MRNFWGGKDRASSCHLSFDFLNSLRRARWRSCVFALFLNFLQLSIFGLVGPNHQALACPHLSRFTPGPLQERLVDGAFKGLRSSVSTVGFLLSCGLINMNYHIECFLQSRAQMSLLDRSLSLVYCNRNRRHPMGLLSLLLRASLRTATVRWLGTFLVFHTHSDLF